MASLKYLSQEGCCMQEEMMGWEGVRPKANWNGIIIPYWIFPFLYFFFKLREKIGDKQQIAGDN